jgi:hypothetical protein
LHANAAGLRNKAQRETKLSMRAMAATLILSTTGRLNLFFRRPVYFGITTQKPQIICYNPLSDGLKQKAV